MYTIARFSKSWAVSVIIFITVVTINFMTFLSLQLFLLNNIVKTVVKSNKDEVEKLLKYAMATTWPM